MFRFAYLLKRGFENRLGFDYLRKLIVVSAHETVHAAIERSGEWTHDEAMEERQAVLIEKLFVNQAHLQRVIDRVLHNYNGGVISPLSFADYLRRFPENVIEATPFKREEKGIPRGVTPVSRPTFIKRDESQTHL